MSIRRTRLRIIAVAGAASVVAALGAVTYTASAAETQGSSTLIRSADDDADDDSSSTDTSDDGDEEEDCDAEEDEDAASDDDPSSTDTSDDTSDDEDEDCGAEDDSFPGTPDSLKPPAGAELVGNAAVEVGVQVYNCINGQFAAKPVPDASLTGSIGLVDHTAGPTFTSTDGSLVKAEAEPLASVDQFESIPQQLMKVTRHGGPKGKMSEVAFIQQLNTSGGARPVGGCERQQNVDYLAIYLFWTAGDE